MAQSMLLPAAVLVVGWVAVLCFATPRHLRADPGNDTAGREASEDVPAG